MPQIKSNFTLRSKQPNFERDSFLTLQDMRNVNPGWMDEGHISYCKETKKHYVFNIDNEYISGEDGTGYFRLFSPNVISDDDSSETPDCGCGCSCSNGEVATHIVFCNLQDMKNAVMLDVKMGQLVYCKETRRPYYSEYDHNISQDDPNQAVFDDTTGYFRPFGVDDSAIEEINSIKSEVEELKKTDSSLSKKITSLENLVGSIIDPDNPIDFSNYVTLDTLEEKLEEKGYLTSIPEEYITNTELEEKGYLTSIPEEYITNTELEEKGYLTSIPEEYITNTELEEKGYLTSIPEEYITNTELEEKGYLTKDDLGDINVNLDGYVTEEELEEKGYLTSIPEEYVDETELASALENFKDSLEGLGVTGLTVDADKGWLRATGETSDGTTKNYFIALTELAKPNAPTIAEANRTKYVVSGSVSISVANGTTGSTMYYRTYNASNDTWGAWTTVSSSFSLDSGFANDKDNESKTFKVQVKAIKNDEESDINVYDITIIPKCDVGSISIVRNNNNNNWSTKASITLSPSPSKDSKSEYSVNGGEEWIEFSKGEDGKYVNKIIEVESTTGAGVYKVKATKKGYANSAISESAAFTLNAKKAYYGFSTKESFSDSTDVINLRYSSESYDLLGAFTIVPEVAEKGYIWLCCVNTLNYNSIVANKGDVIPFGFNDSVAIDGWNCYRNSNKIEPVSTNIYIGQDGV